MKRTLCIVTWTAAALAFACGKEKEPESAGPRTADLSGKKFSDDEFLCTLPENYALTADQDLSEFCAPAPVDDGGEADDGADAGGDDGATPPPAATYADVKPLLTSSCATCHSAAGTPPNLSTFAAAKAAADASLAAITAGDMPPAGPLISADQEIFKSWVDGGMLERAP